MSELKQRNVGEAPPAEELRGLFDEPLVMEHPGQPSWPVGLRLTGAQKITCLVANDLAVVLTREAFEQLFGWFHATPDEISCLGVVKREGNLFVVERFHLVTQTGSGAHTELDPEAVGVLMEELLAHGKVDEAKSLKCWAHSHPGMEVFWSGTDQQTVRLLAADWLVSLVVSDDFAIRARLDTRLPVPLTVDHAPVYVEWGMADDRKDALAREVTEKLMREARLPRMIEQRNDRRVAQESDGAHYCIRCGNWHERGDCLLGQGEFGDLSLDDLERIGMSVGGEDEEEEWGFGRL